jgi:hypothetical protein
MQTCVHNALFSLHNPVRLSSFSACLYFFPYLGFFPSLAVEFPILITKIILQPKFLCLPVISTGKQTASNGVLSSKDEIYPPMVGVPWILDRREWKGDLPESWANLT